MNFLRKCIRYIFRQILYGPNANSDMLIKHLCKKGASIGKGTIFFNPITVVIDETDAYMLKIGKNCQITGGVTILTHDYGWSVTKAVYGDIMGSVRKVEIGDNVYIGMNATILAGTKIGNNVIIGANSLVTGCIPDNCVAVGNPCKCIYSLEEYHEKRKKVQISEAVEIIKCYYSRHNKIPPAEILSDHFWIFTNKINGLPYIFEKQNNLMPGSEDVTWKNFSSHNPAFNSYDELVSYALDKDKRIKS